MAIDSVAEHNVIEVILSKRKCNCVCSGEMMVRSLASEVVSRQLNHGFGQVCDGDWIPALRPSHHIVYTTAAD
jgi:hypothetical protein